MGDTCVLVGTGRTRNFTNATFEVPVIRSDDIHLVLHHSLHDAVISVHAFVTAFQPLPTFVFSDTQCDPVLGPELLQLCDYTWELYGQSKVNMEGEGLEITMPGALTIYTLLPRNALNA